MKNIEISDITTAINKKELLSNNLFFINNNGDEENSIKPNDNNDNYLMQPISTTIYSNDTVKKKNKIEIIEENQENRNSNEEEKKKDNGNEKSIINEISDSRAKVSKSSVPSMTIKNTNSEYIQTSLGQSIILLLNSNNKALVSSIDIYKKSTFIKCNFYFFFSINYFNFKKIYKNIIINELFIKLIFIVLLH